MKSKDSKTGAAILYNDLKRIQSSTNESFSVGIGEDIYDWKVIILGPPDTPYENGMFRARMKFPSTYPDEPPTFIFECQMFHPNIGDNDGKVCISILHGSGDDIYGHESMCERWLPVRNPESIIQSIINLLVEPNCESPANVDAALMYKKDRKEYNRIVRRLAQKSLDF